MLTRFADKRIAQPVSDAGCFCLCSLAEGLSYLTYHWEKYCSCFVDIIIRFEFNKWNWCFGKCKIETKFRLRVNPWAAKSQFNWLSIMFRTAQCRSHRLAYLLLNPPQANLIGPYIPSEKRRGGSCHNCLPLWLSLPTSL